MTDNKLKTLWESYSELKSAEKILAKQSMIIKDELDEFAKETIISYEKGRSSFRDAIRSVEAFSHDFDVLDCWPMPEFEFEGINFDKQLVHLSASYCYDQWEPSFSTINYYFPIFPIKSED